MIWNNVAERANFTAQMITASGYARMMIASITHWKQSTAIPVMIGGAIMNGIWVREGVCKRPK